MASSAAAVLFDLDGVIVDSRAQHLAAWHRLAAERAIGHPPDYFTRVFGLRNDAILGGLLPAVAADDLAVLAGRKEAIFRELARGTVAALPGVHALIEALAARSLPTAVVTSTPRANLDLVLAELDLAGRFGALVAEEDAAKGKPDPEGFLAAASRLGVPPARCVVIEDAPAGLRAARAGGMDAVGVTTTHPPAALADAALIVASLEDSRVLARITGAP